MAEPLTLLWKGSFESGIIPETLKHSIIPPIHKGGSKSIPANYRPVALIKLFEKVVCNKLIQYLENNQLMNENQHGFRSGRSCLTQLLLHHDFVINQLESGSNVDVIYLDFAKAFDKVDHGIVLAKIKAMGIKGKLFSWIQEFLHNRTQSVLVNGTVSSPRKVKSGVPQGSVIGPLIFLVLISDIDENTAHSLVASFADDTRVTKSIRQEEDAIDLQGDLFEIYKWSVDNNTEFNDTKFELVRYGKSDELKQATSYITPSFQVIQEKTSVKDLGVTLSSDGTFKSHVNKIIESAKSMSSWVLRTFTARDRKTMLTLYKSLIRPILEYASILWAPVAKGEIQALEQIQKSFIKKISGISRDYHQALIELNLYSLERRRERYIIIHAWKILEGLVPNLSKENPLFQQGNIEERRGRIINTHNLAATPSHLRKLKSQSFRCFGTKLFNCLPKHIRNITKTSVEEFKHKLDQFLKKCDDFPQTRSGNISKHATNHLFDIKMIEQNTTGSNHSPKPGLSLPRRLYSHQELATSQ